jgi:tRNA threonylcarbamoyladenosine biosynthesis protein TsaB
MESPLILNIETSLGGCSVALAKGNELLAQVVEPEKNKASERLHNMIEDVCQMAEIPKRALEAVAVSGGPGSYTGLRIGVSAAKGICYALDIPLIHIETFQAMHAAVSVRGGMQSSIYIGLIDARRKDVFCSILNHEGGYIQKPGVVTIQEDAFNTYIKDENCLFFGNAVEKLHQITHLSFHMYHIEAPVAEDMIALSAKKFVKSEWEDLAYYEPEYYKDVYLTNR